MIPITLRLHNFMCYAADTPALDFRGLHLACLAGDNGHGKSALLDALTWALWGRARARSDNELIRQGESEMEVEFEFELDENTYRVLRKRDSRGRGQSLLEFQVRAADGYRPLTENSLRATQARIDGLLRMDYDTFINSAYIQQGKADAFTTMAPADRKSILAQILGLTQYDEYEERAKARLKETERAVDGLNATLAEIEREVAQLPEHEAAAQTMQAELLDVTERLRSAEKVQQAGRRQQQELLTAQHTLADLQQRLTRAAADVAETTRDLETRRGRRDMYRQLLEARGDIEAGYAQWQTARAAEAAWQGRALSHAQTTAHVNRLEGLVAAARNELLTEQRLLQNRLAETTASAARLAPAKLALKAARGELAGLAEQEVTRAATQAARGQAAERRAELGQINRQLREQMTEIKERIADLSAAGATCPLCRQALSEHDHSRLLADFQTEGTALGDKFRGNTAEVAGLEQEERRFEAELAALDGALRRQGALQRQEAQAEQAQREAEKAGSEASGLQGRLDEIALRLEERSYAAAEQGELAAARAALAELAYDSADHETARQRVVELQPWDARQHELARALEEHDTLAAQVTTLEERLARWQETLAADRARAQELAEAVAELPSLRSELARQDAAVRALEDQVARAQLQLGAARQRIDTCRRLQGQQKDLLERRERLIDARGLYDELRVAFGKKGVQAMIIEAAVPEIEEEANRLLGRMTNYRMSVSLETQRETKKGDARETLDIVIKDELGVRAYEMLSGGEAFRTNFAIRIALSKLLARRAGARLQTLIIDEGFGTQDASGRERLVEAITSIQQDFERILVVTHIEELKDQFPVRINVVKNANGSTFSLS